MRATFLLAIGLLFLCLALLAPATLYILEKPEEQLMATENIPGATLQPQMRTNTPPGTVIPTFTSSPTQSPTSTSTATLAVIRTYTNTPGAGGIPTTDPGACDRAELLNDVTIPDGTIFPPGATFTKTWRLRNVGSCAWGTSYQIAFVSGEQMGAPSSAALPKNVAVGETVDISINMTVPSAAGSYRGYWMFKNSNGSPFGIGPRADGPWWVDINVSGPTVTPGGPSNTPGPTVTTGGPPVTPAPGITTIAPTSTMIDASSQLVEAEWPTKLRVGQSGTIRVSLIKVGAGYTPTVEITSSSNTAVVSTLVIVGTPDEEPRFAFGEGYEAFAIAHMGGALFNISLASQEYQSLDQSRVDWIWNVASDNPGLQGIDISIEVEWKRTDNSGETVRRQIWRSHLEIDVFQPIISTGQVSAFSLFSAFIGSGLSIPWLYEMISKRKLRRRRKAKNNP